MNNLDQSQIDFTQAFVKICKIKPSLALLDFVKRLNLSNEEAYELGIFVALEVKNILSDV